MILTGKCKVDFEKWFTDEIERTEQSLTKLGRVLVVDEFYTRIIQSMQYGVYVDFFWQTKKMLITLKSDDILSGDIEIDEARTKAIEKANELYNNKTP